MTDCNEIKNTFPKVTQEPPVNRYSLVVENAFPEGMALSSDGMVVTGSSTTGTIYTAEQSDSTLVARSVAGANLPAALGMTVDANRLYFTSGDNAQVGVYDLNTNQAVNVYTAPSPTAGDSTLLNDLVLVGDYGYVTDSYRPVLFRFATDGSASELTPWLDLTDSPIRYESGFNLNGIDVTPGGEHLIVMQSNTGKLFRITVATQEITEINLDGENIQGGDGIYLAENRVYVALNAPGKVARVAMNADFSRGEVTIVAEDLQFPTAVAVDKSVLYILNSQLDKRNAGQPAELPFVITTVSLTD